MKRGARIADSRESAPGAPELIAFRLSARISERSLNFAERNFRKYPFPVGLDGFGGAD